MSGFSLSADEVWQGGDIIGPGDIEPAAKILPETHTQFGACFHQRQKGIVTLAARVGTGAAGYFAFGKDRRKNK